jgi:hypothetical protein
VCKKELDKAQESNTIVYTVDWNPTKSARLKRIRGVSFEEIVCAKYLGIEDHPSRNDQRMFIFEYQGYVWAVPFVVEAKQVFLKTIYPSRKFKKMYREGGHHEKDKID